MPLSNSATSIDSIRLGGQSYEPDQLIAANVTPRTSIHSDGDSFTESDIMQYSASTDYSFNQQGLDSDRVFIAQTNENSEDRTVSEIKHNRHGEYIAVETEDGKLNIPNGDPAFGLPTNFKAYNQKVNKYVKWLESYNGNSYGWNDMNQPQKEDFANALRHSLGIGLDTWCLKVCHQIQLSAKL